MKKAFTIIELIMVIVIIGFLAAIAVPRMSNTQKLANDSAAKANVEIISAALENYATGNNGSYTDDEADLTGGTSPYLYRSFCGQTNLQGYDYSCSLATTGYTIVASPTNCGSSGSNSHTVTTGGILTSAGCI